MKVAGHFKETILKCSKLKLDGENDYSDRGLKAKILKLEENNQYGFAMTKYMTIGSIK